jgi:hypothetical protein
MKPLKYGISLKIPRELDRRYKLTEQEILLIKELYRTRQCTISELSRKYNVHYNTIRYHVSVEYNLKGRSSRTKIRNMERGNEYNRRIRSIIPGIFREYNKLTSQEFRKNKKLTVNNL